MEEEELLFKHECYDIIGACIDVHRELGVGFSEIVYKDALEYEFQERCIPYRREVEYQVHYKDVVLPHKFYADFVVFDSIILEVKTVSELKNEHLEQTINYLAVSGNEVGLLVNFRSERLKHKRLILTR
ncbi:MAG: GxxExxY protein [Fluviicola sp.]|nr:GxxExxY protein [Fluviicola sp.]